MYILYIIYILQLSFILYDIYMPIYIHIYIDIYILFGKFCNKDWQALVESPLSASKIAPNQKFGTSRPFHSNLGRRPVKTKQHYKPFGRQ